MSKLDYPKPASALFKPADIDAGNNTASARAAHDAVGETTLPKAPWPIKKKRDRKEYMRAYMQKRRANKASK